MTRSLQSIEVRMPDVADFISLADDNIKPLECRLEQRHIWRLAKRSSTVRADRLVVLASRTAANCQGIHTMGGSQVFQRNFAIVHSQQCVTSVAGTGDVVFCTTTLALVVPFKEVAQRRILYGFIAQAKKTGGSYERPAKHARGARTDFQDVVMATGTQLVRDAFCVRIVCRSLHNYTARTNTTQTPN